MTDTLSNPKAITAYLKEAGYKVSQSTVYKHRDEGRIPAQKDGRFLVKDVDRYAGMHLKRLDGEAFSEDMEAIQRQKLTAEARKADAQADHWELKTLVDSGQYIDRELFNGELAARAAIFRNALATFFRTNVGEMIRLVKGEPEMGPDLIDFWLEKLEGAIGRYAEPKKWPVMAVSTMDSKEMDIEEMAE
ncbi:helix-turn-helix domain-containing protein [Desulfoluna butyratoxydans]|uniref:Uncharacterized protein n=1 Tax=Desulfoluna butyratoxydans TaxID=231438 RepID=A0A4U8YXT8_9BACT|nr:helix-turn-helix domain-containing protein [Desulfoluna butyratoxydans]VFQ46892.1 hypothetical protein MSL71_45740 [Desulfoluna butyratoxydans]